MNSVRHITLDPQGAQILVEFDEDQGHIRVAGVRALIIEVTETGGIWLQARAQVGGGPEGPWTEQRTYICSGTQFWTLVSDQPVADSEQAGLWEAKQLMGRGQP